MKWSNKNEAYQYSGQIIMFHQPGFPWTKENFPSYSLPFGSFWCFWWCEVAIIWPEYLRQEKTTGDFEDFGVLNSSSSVGKCDSSLVTSKSLPQGRHCLLTPGPISITRTQLFDLNISARFPLTFQLWKKSPTKLMSFLDCGFYMLFLFFGRNHLGSQVEILLLITTICNKFAPSFRTT